MQGFTKTIIGAEAQNKFEAGLHMSAWNGSYAEQWTRDKILRLKNLWELVYIIRYMTNFHNCPINYSDPF